jgi:hypothetical protein
VGMHSKNIHGQSFAACRHSGAGSFAVGTVRRGTVGSIFLVH